MTPPNWLIARHSPKLSSAIFQWPYMEHCCHKFCGGILFWHSLFTATKTPNKSQRPPWAANQITSALALFTTYFPSFSQCHFCVSINLHCSRWKRGIVCIEWKDATSDQPQAELLPLFPRERCAARVMSPKRASSEAWRNFCTSFISQNRTIGVHDRQNSKFKHFKYRCLWGRLYFEFGKDTKKVNVFLSRTSRFFALNAFKAHFPNTVLRGGL